MVLRRLSIRRILAALTVAIGVATGATAVSASAPVNEQSPPGVQAHMRVHTFTRQLTIPFTVTSAPVDPSLRTSTVPGDPRLPADRDGAVFYSTSFQVSGTPFAGYVGVQANSMAVMSVWGATGCRTSSVPSSFCSNFDEDGRGWTMRISYPWRVGQRYEFVLTALGDLWWTAALRISATGVSTTVGSIRLPAHASGIAPWASWIEWFHAPLGGHCTDSPNAGVTFWPLVGDGQVTAPYFEALSQTCRSYDVTSVGADGSASIGSYPQGRPAPPVATPAQSRVSVSGAQRGCLAVLGPSHGAPVTSAVCGTSGTRFDVFGAAAGTFTLHPSGHQSLCLDVPNESKSPGVSLVVGACTGHDSQRWYSRARTGMAPALVNVNSGWCAESTLTSDGARVPVQSSCTSAATQGWTIGLVS